MDGDGRALLVLYGSETGNAQVRFALSRPRPSPRARRFAGRVPDPQSIRLTPPSLEPDPRRLQDVAERIGREATRRRYAVNVLAMDDYEVTELPNARRVVFVTSTMGQGDPPANVRLFWRFLLRKSLPSDSLSRLAFACFGLGDSHYQKYNVVAKKLAKRLCNLGARPILDLGLGDDQHPSGHEAALDPWLAELWTKLDLECPEAQVSLASERYHRHDEESEEFHPPFGKDVDGDLDPCRFAVETFAPTESESTPRAHSPPTRFRSSPCAPPPPNWIASRAQRIPWTQNYSAVASSAAKPPPPRARTRLLAVSQTTRWRR